MTVPPRTRLGPIVRGADAHRPPHRV